MNASSFNPEAIIRKVEFFYNRGEPDKARRLLMKSWPGMEADVDCLYQHLLVEARMTGDVPLFLKSVSFDELGVTYQLPDWIISAARDLELHYGEREGHLRWQKALAVFAERYSTPEGQRRFKQACARTAQMMTEH
jgi:hypothetical protein